MTQEERIDRYILGKMDDHERLEFDKELLSNPNLANAVKEFSPMVMGLKTYGLQQKLKNIMNENVIIDKEVENDEKTYEDKKPAPRSFLWYYLVVIVLVIIGIFFLLKPESTEQPTTSAQEIYAAHYYPDPGLPTKMGTETDLDFDRGMVHYKQGNYKKAISVWSEQSSDNSTTTYYLGAAYLADGDQATASNQFLKLTEGDSFYDRSQWYLALISLKESEIDSSIQHLNSILKLDQSTYHSRAKELLEILKI